MTVNYSANGSADDRLAIRNQGTSTGQISVSGSTVAYEGTTIGTVTGGTGTTALVITFNANATPTAVSALLQNLTYANVSEAPSTAARTVRFVVTDGDGGTSTAATKTINVTAVNDVPTIALPGSTVAYPENDLATFIDATATIADLDAANFNTGNLTVNYTAGGTADDRLTIRNQGTGAGQISLDGRIVKFECTAIGTYTGGIGTTPLVITFNSNSATPAAAQALLRAIAFANVSQNPTTIARSLQVTVSDGITTSTPATRTINVAAVNDAPLVGNTTVLYDGATGMLPSSSRGWLYGGPGVTPTVSNGATNLNTTTNPSFAAGFSNSTVILDRTAGYVVSFNAQVVSESRTATADKDLDGKDDRAGFSIIVVSSDNTKAIELGFLSDRIFAQEDGTNQVDPSLQPDTTAPNATRTLFTQAEAAAFTTAASTSYDLAIKDDTYTLFANGTVILSGRLRDYTAFSGAPDPYQVPNQIFFGDNTTSATANLNLSRVAVTTNPATLPSQTVNEDAGIVLPNFLTDLDTGSSSVTLTLAVTNGMVTVNNVSGSTLSNNGTATVTVAGTLNQINTILTNATGITYQGNANYNESDTLTLSLNDNGASGGSAITTTKTLPIVINAVNDAPVLGNSPFTVGNILVSTNNTLLEYIPTGTLVRSIPIPVPLGASPETARDLILNGKGNVLVYNGTFTPFLSTYAANQTWSHQTVPAWNTINNVSYGGISVFQNFAYTTDMQIAGEVGSDVKGIIRFNLDTGNVDRFATTKEFIDLNVGLDGWLYGLESTSGTVSVYDPLTLAFQKTISVPLGDPRAIAINSNGEIFAAAWDGKVYQYTNNGNPIKNVATGSSNLTDINLDPDSRILLGVRGVAVGKVIITNESLASFTTLSIGSSDTFVTSVLMTPTLNAVDEDAAAPVGNVGTLVSQIIVLNPPVGGSDNVSDVDSVATGLAITAINAANGNWFYSTDNGTNWIAFSTLGTVSSTNSLLLPANASTRVYFQPNANCSGTISNALTFKAWDQTTGTAGTTANTTLNGGATAFSSATGIASIQVNSVNDAPTPTNNTLSAIAEDSGVRIISFASLLGNDSAGPTNENGQSLTITNVSNVVGGTAVINGSNIEFTPTLNDNGTASFEYTVQGNGSTNGANDFRTATGTASFNITEVNDAATATNDTLSAIAEDSGVRIISFAGLLGNDSAGPVNESGQSLTITNISNVVGGTAVINGSNIEFTPTLNYNDPASFDYTVQDNGTTNGAADFKTATGTASFILSAVNDAPTLTGNATLPAVTQNTTNPSGSNITTLFGSLFSDVDTGASFSGLAIRGNTANSNTEGTWQYSINSTTWANIGTVADGSTALALAASTLVRFVPVGGYNGTPGGLTVRALDNTYSGGFSTGTTRVLVDTTSNGGSTAIAGTFASLGTSVMPSLPSLVWRNSGTGQNSVWQLNGFTVQTTNYINPVADPNWQIVSTADFNRDGTPDLLWRNQATGENSIWQMNGTTVQTTTYINPVNDPNWQIVGTADFNRDGTPDLLWRNQATGENSIWQMNGTTVQTTTLINPVGNTNWQIAGVANLNGDSTPDLPRLKTASLERSLVANLNGDSTPDLLWRNKVTGENSIWQMNGTTV